MHCLILQSSRRWLCALSGSVRGRKSEFRNAQNFRRVFDADQCYQLRRVVEIMSRASATEDAVFSFLN